MKLVHFIAVVCCSFSPFASIAAGGVPLENPSRETLRVYLKGSKDKEYRGPFTIPPRSKMEVNVEPGWYYVAIQHPDKRFDYLRWQDYTDSKPKSSYNISLCTTCAPINGIKIIQLGITIVESQHGVLVTHVLDDSPARKLYSIKTGDTVAHFLQPGKALITNINGKQVRNAADLIRHVLDSPSRVELTVSSLRGQYIENYWTEMNK